MINILDYIETLVENPEEVSNNKAHYLFNLLFLRPVLYVIMVICGLAVLAWIMSAFGVFFILVAIGDKNFILAITIASIDLMILGYWISGKLNEFKK